MTKPQPQAITSPLPGPETIRAIRAETDTVLLSFSCGKDSIATWLAVRDHFPNVVPFYMQRIPGISFVERSLAYYEDFFGCHIVRALHPWLYQALNSMVWQPPERFKIIEAARLPVFTYDDVSRVIIEDQKLPESTFTLSGVRAADNPHRKANLRRTGPINWARRMAYPVWDMKKAALVELISAAGVSLPIDYEWFGRSFDGLDYRFISVIKEKSPQDWQLILDWFPLAELELLRYDKLTS